ncbi:MAG: AAA family ATPase [Prevotella sp.]|nr:AAA family ATPase [Prevotella sp.]
MDRLSVNHAVYSTHLKGYEPDLADKNVFLYIHAKSMVVVCFDLCGNREEIADEQDPYDLKIPEYYSYNKSRTSPVWQLSEAMKEMDHRAINIFPPVDIHGVLLSESNILNFKDMKDKWDAMNITVIDGLKGLRHREIATNKSYSAEASTILRAILDEEAYTRNFKLEVPDFSYLLDEKQAVGDEAKEDDEFEKLLKRFIDNGYEKVEEGNLPFEESDSSDIYDDDDEVNIEAFPEGSVHKIEDLSFPDGTIEQNDKISVKVEILRPIANPREELDKLVGCADIKRRMDELVALTHYNRLMRKMFPNSKQHEVSLHSVFLGKPGTGKTTVCKIFGSLLRQAGALSKGHVVVCDRGTFLGTLWGDEERSVRQVVEMAQGGVLMIDEAYQLNGKHEGDPGKLVVPLLMNVSADEKQRDIAIVLCGYKEPMEKLLETNPGLYSRFPNRFEFADFTVDELLDITRLRIKEYEYEFTPEAWDKYRLLLARAYAQRDPNTWGNARFVANQLERIYIQHAMRCVRQRPTDKRQLRLLTPEDILPIEVQKEKRRIGF